MLFHCDLVSTDKASGYFVLTNSSKFQPLEAFAFNKTLSINSGFTNDWDPIICHRRFTRSK